VPFGARVRSSRWNIRCACYGAPLIGTSRAPFSELAVRILSSESVVLYDGPRTGSPRSLAPAHRVSGELRRIEVPASSSTGCGDRPEFGI
jgi:hypothetical protein